MDSVMQEQYKSYNTFWLTLELMLRMKPRMIEVADAHKLTPQQLHVLGFLSDKQPHPMSWLAALLFCDASNVTGIIDRMVTLSFVKRVECITDRRVKMVQLTDHGEKIRSQIMHDLSIESQVRVDNILSKEEQTLFRDMVIKLLVATETEAMNNCLSNKISK
jgi:DNA-binding MarR family transcriptional regulator